jgi:membrane protein required for colicin V production
LSLFDIFFLVTLVIAAVGGFRNGFIVEVLSTLGFVVGLYLALYLAFPLVFDHFSESKLVWLVTLGAFCLVFFGTMWLMNRMAKALKQAAELAFLGIFDKVFGIVIGMVKWVLTVSVLTWVLYSIEIGLPEAWTSDSWVFPWVVDVAPVTFGKIAEWLPFLNGLLDSLKEYPSSKVLL